MLLLLLLTALTPLDELCPVILPLEPFALRPDFSEAADKPLFERDTGASGLPLVLFPLLLDLIDDAVDKPLFDRAKKEILALLVMVGKFFEALMSAHVDRK